MYLLLRLIFGMLGLVSSYNLFAGEDLLSERKHEIFVFRSFDYMHPDHVADIQAMEECVQGLNHPKTFEDSRQKLFQRAQRGDPLVFEWLFDVHHNPDVNIETWEHSYFKKLWPHKNVHDFFMQDLQEVGINLEAFDYYLYDIRPEKSLMVQGLKMALQKGWKNSNKYMNVMWQLFNDIRDDVQSPRSGWVQTFKELQCLGYMKNIVSLEDLTIFPLGELDG